VSTPAFIVLRVQRPNRATVLSVASGMLPLLGEDLLDSEASGGATCHSEELFTNNTSARRRHGCGAASTRVARRREPRTVDARRRQPR
jgi:hypothetical protein